MNTNRPPSFECKIKTNHGSTSIVLANKTLSIILNEINKCETLEYIDDQR